jgi:hypothetical protein
MGQLEGAKCDFRIRDGVGVIYKNVKEVAVFAAGVVG